MEFEQIKAIYKKAYDYMDVTLIDGNCGEYCNYNCCRDENEGNKMGIYLYPFEYETMLEDYVLDNDLMYEYHSHEDYFMAAHLEGQYFLYCGFDKGCLRDLRPIQCRTYPLEPHITKGELKLVIEKNQIHDCPFVLKEDKWHPDFIEGIYKGWQELIKIDEVRKLVIHDSRNRVNSFQVQKIVR